MWKSRKEEEHVTPSAPAARVAPAPAINAAVNKETSMDYPKAPEARMDMAHIGKSVLVRGELSGSEDLYLDGQVEGSIELRGNSLTVGPNGRVKANINARDVVVHGKVEGNVNATGRVELKKTAVQIGDIATQRIVIEDGAFFKGGIDIHKENASKPAEVKTDVKTEAKPQAAAAAAAASGASVVQPSLIAK
jgi:cytoskeletal protein CcmA (bactofilin family)